MYRATMAICTLLFVASIAEAEDGWPWRCGGGWDSTGSSPLTSLDEDSIHALVIISCGGFDCDAALDSRHWAIPDWTSHLFDANDAASVTSFYRDNSRGALILDATIIDRSPNDANDDTCVYSRHIPCGFPWAPRDASPPDYGMWCNVCDSNCADCDLTDTLYSPCICEFDSFYADILRKLDDSLDFSLFDRFGDAQGGPDGNVDLVIFAVLMYRQDSCGADTCPGSLMGYGRLLRDYETDDGVTISRDAGCTCWINFSFYESAALIAHELGHTYVGHEQVDKGGAFDNLGLGGYDAMSRGGFKDETGAITYPSLFNPFARGPGYAWEQGANWIPTNTITTTQYDMTLQPFSDPALNYDQQGACYKLSLPGDTIQWFLVTSHNLQSNWERFWPAAGIMVWRVNLGFSYWEEPLDYRGVRLVEIESADGNWHWDTVRVFSGHQVVVREEQENPESGYDSLDFEYTDRSGQTTFMFDPAAGYYYGVGYPSLMFGVGDCMDDRTNPTMRLRVNEYPHYPRVAKTGFALTNIRQSNDTFFVADLIVNAWQGTMTQSHTWFDTIKVTGALTVGSTATLTVEEGTVVQLDQDATITVNGTLDIQGTSGDHVVMKAKDTGETWKWIKVLGGELNMQYVDVQDVSHYCVYTDNPADVDIPVNISHCTLDGSDIIPGGVALVLWNRPGQTQRVYDTIIENVDTTATGMYLYNCNVAFDSVRVMGMDFVNSYIKKVTGSFTHSEFGGRCSYYTVLLGTPACTPYFDCCKFSHLAPTSGSWPSSIFSATGCSPTFGDGGYASGLANVIADSSQFLLIMQGTSALPVFGKNDWTQEQSNGKFMNWLSGPVAPNPPHNVEGQYWSPTPDSTLFAPNNIPYFDFDPYESEEWTQCDSGSGGGSSIGGSDVARGRGVTTDEGENYDSLFAEALRLERVEEYSDAQPLYRIIACGTSTLRLRWSAMAHIVSTETFVGNGESWIPALLDSLVSAEANAYDSRVLAERLLASHRLNREQYNNAAEICVDLLSSGLTFEDSIYVAMDLIGIQMAGGMGGGSLDEFPNAQIPQELVVRSAEQGMAVERSLFEALNGASPITESPSAPSLFSRTKTFPTRSIPQPKFVLSCRAPV